MRKLVRASLACSLFLIGAVSFSCSTAEPAAEPEPEVAEKEPEAEDEGEIPDDLPNDQLLTSADDGDEDADEVGELDEDGTPPPVANAIDVDELEDSMDLAAGKPAKIPSKIRYIVVIVKENHTFDNYFTDFPDAESTRKAKIGDHTYKRPVAKDGELRLDPCHANRCGKHAYNDGKMNGFSRDGAGKLPYIRYTEEQIPNYWHYARHFVLFDHFFSTTLGPSSPGHEVFWSSRSMTLDNPKCTAKDETACGSAKGCFNTSPKYLASVRDPGDCTTHQGPPCFNIPSLPDHLPKGFTWRNYGGAIASMIKSVAKDPDAKTHFRKEKDLLTDIGAGRLANLTIIHLNSGERSEHPKASPCVGERYSTEIINALMKLPQWKKMAIALTWDDYGGFYDHVKPKVHQCDNGAIYGNGFRLPLLLMSPYAKKGVNHHHTEQASVPRLVEELWGMRFMSERDPHARDGRAGSLLTAFDFHQTPRAPIQLPTTRKCPGEK